MAKIEDYYKVVEDAISLLGVEPDNCRDDEDRGAWALMKGDQEVWIDCWHIEEEDRAYFQVMAPVLEIPDTMPNAFYRELLEINYNLFGVAFGIYKNMLALKVIREAEGLDANEAFAMITRIGSYAAEHGPELQEKYLGGPNIAPEDN